MIEEYSFGRIVIDGKSYENDVKIFEDEIKTWRRQESHKLKLADIDDVLKTKPKMLIVGTGYEGCMKVQPEVKEYCRKHKIKLVAELTGKAVMTYNKFKGKGVVAVLHITC